MNLHEIVSVEAALALAQVVFIDMRTPAEFSKGHIPGAYNLPLFENEEEKRSNSPQFRSRVSDFRRLHRRA